MTGAKTKNMYYCPIGRNFVNNKDSFVDCQTKKIEISQDIINIPMELTSDDFENEYMAAVDIKIMIKNLIDNKKEDSEEKIKLMDLFNSLSNLYIKKSKLSLEKYEELYEIFENSLDKEKEYFYLNINKATHKYDDIIPKINKIYWE